MYVGGVECLCVNLRSSKPFRIMYYLYVTFLHMAIYMEIVPFFVFCKYMQFFLGLPEVCPSVAQIW